MVRRRDAQAHYTGNRRLVVLETTDYTRQAMIQSITRAASLIVIGSRARDDELWEEYDRLEHR